MCAPGLAPLLASVPKAFVLMCVPLPLPDACSVVPHFQSGLFDSLTNVTFDHVDKTRMTDMFSQQGERVRASCLSGGYQCRCSQPCADVLLLALRELSPCEH